MNSFAKALMIFGILMIGLSALLMPFIEINTPERFISSINLYIGFVLFAFGLIYLIVKRQIEIKKNEKGK